MRPFLVCVHDASPAWARETRLIIRDLAPLVGRRLSVGVVPDWHGAWPLARHPDYCRLVHEGAEELLLHGYVHRRRRGFGPVSWLTSGSDEMNGLDGGETRRALARGQRVLTDVFGAPARGFLPPAWQRGYVSRANAHDLGIEHVLGFFSLAAWTGRTVPLATWSWDCGRWPPLGHFGHAVGRLRHALGGGVPTLAIHPADLARGFWPRVLRLVRDLLDRGHEPSTVARLLETTGGA
jgi:peptidoglycan/xylan/chitin deacetylase (PgdA/CDA1 family)